MVDAAVGFALKEIRQLISSQGNLLCGVGGAVEALEKQLKEMKYLLEDADGRRHESKTIANWISEIRGLAYRAEAAIELHSARASPTRKQGLKNLIRRYSCTGFYSLRQLATEISDIDSKLETINKAMQESGVKRSLIDARESSAASDETNRRRKTFPDFEIDDCFVGKQEDLKRLISLVADDEEHRVVSVWGMGGIGKTTVTRRVYNQIMQTKKGCFESSAWVCVTQQCRVRSVLEGVLKQLNPKRKEGVSSLSMEEMIEQLCEIQRSRRCLVVLDDLWETSDWEELKHAFYVRDLRSKILVTTRKRNVAEIGFAVEVGLLDLDDAWELLEKKAFPHGKTPEFVLEENSLDEVGKELVGKCGNLPLAICLLGGILRKKNSMREWELVNEKFNTVLYRGHDESDNKIDGVVNLSYENLPYYLKPCFLYLGIFKEDESIDVNHVYGMWIAQGMISDENIRGKDETLMEIAELYLSELASRSLVQVVIDDFIPTRKHRSCKLHDVVRELCLKIGENEDFGVEILEYKDGKFSTIPRVARHLAIRFKNKHDGLTGTTRTVNPSKHLRSLRILNDVKWDAIEFGVIGFPPQSIFDFKKHRFLREIVIESFKFEGGKLPRGITNLVLLRCLRLQYCDLDELPSSIRNLVHLDTLDLSGSWNVRVPNVLNELFRLKHLFLPPYEKDHKVGKNHRLRSDEGLHELESLVGYNSSMHELKSTTTTKNLRHLSAEIHDERSLLVILNAIATNWSKLQRCAVQIEGGCRLTSEEVVMQLLTCPNLDYLGVSVEMGRLPAGGDFIRSRLARLRLSGCGIEDDPMGILGRLPWLIELCLRWGSFVGEEMTCRASGFRRLKRLELTGLPKLREWKVEEGAMSLVSEIEFDYCPNLEMVPDGLSCISSLKRVRIFNMPELGKRVLASGEDFHKLSHVPSINIIHD